MKLTVTLAVCRVLYRNGLLSAPEVECEVQGPTSALISWWSEVQYSPLWMARSGAIALWCQTVMSRVQGNTINTMARISLLFGISRIGGLARHYLETRRSHIQTPNLLIQTKLNHCDGAPDTEAGPEGPRSGGTSELLQMCHLSIGALPAGGVMTRLINYRSSGSLFFTAFRTTVTLMTSR